MARTSHTILLVAVALFFHGIAGASRASPGLSVDAAGKVWLNGKQFHGIGVNYYDAFTRTLEAPSRTNYADGFHILSARGIPFIRFSGSGYWPGDWRLYQTNREEYFNRLDGVIHCAETNGIGLVPSLFWNLSTIPDLVGEPCNAWGNTKSRTMAFMREYTREVVTRYHHSPAIWGWEFGNEYNLAADLPNAEENRPKIVPQLGTPVRRSAADDLTSSDIRTAIREFALEVRRHDSRHFISSGNAIPRPSAWHQASNRTWDADTPEQFGEVLDADNPAPVDTISLRAYDLKLDLPRLPIAMVRARQAHRPLFIGEFGVSGPDNGASRDAFGTMLEAIKNNHVPLAALWVYDFDGQASDWSVTATNHRRWQLDAIELANRHDTEKP